MKVIVPASICLTDEPVSIRVEQLRPGAAVAITAELLDLERVRWRSGGQFFANAAGWIDTNTFGAENGTYDGVDPWGLAWSMQPVDPVSTAGGPTVPSLIPESPQEWMVVATTDAGERQEAVLRRTWLAPGVVTHEVNDGGLRGVFYEPPTSKVDVAVMVVAGSGGGVSTSLAPLLASHGIPTLALAWFNYRDLPKSLAGIGLEYFREGARWIRQRGGRKRLVVVGISRGSEAVALSAAHFDGFADALVLYVPSHVVESGYDETTGKAAAAWTLAGRPLDFVPMGEKAAAMLERLGADSVKRYAPVYLEKWAQEGIEDQHGIPIEAICAPTLLLSAGNDALWPSWLGAARLLARAKAADPSARVTHISFAGAGHAISRPGEVASLSTVNHHPLLRHSVALGGVPRVNAHAALAALREVLLYVRKIAAGSEETPCNTH